MGGESSAYGGEEMRIQDFGGGSLRERDNLENLGVDERHSKMDLQEVVWKEWTGLTWLRIGTGSGRL